MADLARIKRNVAKMASMNAPEEDIDGYIASEGVTIDDVRNYRELKPMTDEQRVQIQANNDEYNRKQAERNKDQWFVSLVENKPDGVIQNITRPVARFGLSAIQGISNAGLNPAGYVARAAGIDTKPLEAQTAGERATELAGQYGFDSAAIVPTLGLAAGSIPKIAPYAQALTEGGVPLALATSTGGAIAEGITNPTNDFERFLANMGGAGLAGSVIGGLRRTATNVAGGLKEALPNERANAALSKGITADKGVARTISKEAPAVYDELNADMTQALNKATGRKLDIEQANQNARNAYENYIAQNADYPVFNPKSAKEQADENFKRWFEGSQVVDENGQPRRYYHGTPKKFDAFDKDKIVRGNGFWFTDDMNYASSIRANEGNPTVLETYLNAKNPIDVNKNREDFIKLSKEYFGNSRDFSDVGDNFIIGEAMSDKGFPEFLKSKGYDAIKMGNGIEVFEPNQIKSVNNSGAWSSSPSLSDAGWKAEPSIKDIKLNQYQQNAMNEALAKGASMSDYPLGSLDATHKAQGILNDMINTSYDTKNPLKPRATTETSQLMSLKKVFNELMEPSGVKPLDARISKAKTLRSNFEKGYNFKPSETKFDNLGLNTARDKKAFLQGRLAKLQDNVLSEGGTNLADAIIKDQNTLKKLMPKKQFDSLMDTAGSLKESFSRLKSIEGQANRELLKDIERGGSPWRENIESKGSLIGRALDVTSNALNKGSRRRLAEAYLNPEISEIRQFGGVKGALKGAGSASLRQALIGNKEK